MIQPGKRFAEAIKTNPPLQIAGAINANHALLAEQAGFQAIYLSGGGVSAGSLGVPDLGITNLNDVLVDLRRIANVSSLPILVDIDTGFGPSAFNVARTVKEIEQAGAAAIHIEDQAGAKRCGHRPGKTVVSQQEMIDRLHAATDARYAADFQIGARTDALASESEESVLDRATAYAEAGADFLFLEAVESLDTYAYFTRHINIPVLANITEFGMTPLWTKQELSDAGVKLVLYPLSAFRAANKAAAMVYREILRTGTQKDLLTQMQTREELYTSIGYYEYEHRLDRLNER